MEDVCVIFMTLWFLHSSASGSEIVFRKIPIHQAVVYGQDLFLDCVVENLTSGDTEGLSIQWRHDSVLLDPKASMFFNGTLLVPSVVKSDMGNYTCVVLDDSENLVMESLPALVFHAFIKMFAVSPTPVIAIEDDIVSFDCITGESAPPPDILWEKDGEPFYGGDQYNATYGGYSPDSLIRQFSMKLILKAKPYLDGVYNCLARNPILKIDVRSLKVLMRTAELESAPYVMEELVVTETIKSVNQPMLLDCPITGKPQVTNTWFKNSILIERNPAFFVLQNGSLHNPMATLDDDGTYRCEGSNSLGLARSPNINVTIARLEMTFINPPSDLNVIAGLPAMLTCTPPLSVPLATVTWYKDNKLLVPRTGKQSVRIVATVDNAWNVVFDEIQKIDEGEYFCVANNEYSVPQSRTSGMATVSVGGAPIFVQPPTGLTIEKGKLAQMTCYVQGDPFPEVTWLFEDEKLEVTESVSFRQGNQELWIGNIHKGFEGTYTCRAVNRYGTIETRVYIKVLVPPVVLQPVGHTIVSVGDTAVIPCGVYSDPDPTVTWYKDSAALVIGERFTQLHDGLYITSVKGEDAGKYLCSATNIAGTVESEGSLEIQVLPHFIEVPESQVITIGRNTTLTCVANGHPKPEVTWYFNGSSLFPQDTLLSLNRQTLFLLEVSWLHVGEYMCKAQNIEGSATSTAKIALQIPPKIQKIEGVPLLYQGENLNLKCHLTGIPSPLVEWQFNRQSVQESFEGRITLPDDNTLSVKFVTQKDAGVYTCRGTNAAGVTQKDTQVHILNRPSPPVLHSIETVSATSILLSWSTEQSEPQTPVETVVIYYRKKLQPTSQLLLEKLAATYLQYEVEDLDPASEYIFMVAAVNGAGTSDVSNILAARTYDAGPSEPRNVYIIDVKPHNLTIGWEIPETTNGEIRKYKIQYSEKNSPEERNIILTSNGSASVAYIIRNLKPYTWFTLQVQAATMEADQVLWGNWSQDVDVKTLEAEPTGRPREVRAQAMSSDTIQVTWEAVLQQKQNGPIKRYYIRYWLLSNTSHQLGEKVSESLDLKVNISDLDPWIWYKFKVTSENNGGLGEPSEDIVARTLPAAPTEAPTNVTAEVLTPHTVLVSWLLPHESEWNSELSGFIIKYWREADDNVTRVTSLGIDDPSVTVSGLNPWTTYELQIAAFTDQLAVGEGPFSSNITVKTMQSEPGMIKDFEYTATITTLRLSWKPPVITNGIITEYRITYQLIRSAVATTPSPIFQPIIFEYAMDVYNDSKIMTEIFRTFRVNINVGAFLPLAEMCDSVLANQTFVDSFDKSDINQSETVLQRFSISNDIIDWMVGKSVNVLDFCKDLEMASLQMKDRYSDTQVYPVFNITSSDTQVTITSLESEHVYNVTVSAATIAGFGKSVSIQATTSNGIGISVRATTTKRTTRAPLVPITRPSTSLAPPLEQKGDNSQLNIRVIVGGGVSGLFLILIILLVAICLFLRRRRSLLEEKSQVIRDSSADENVSNNTFGELDRPRLPTIAAAAEDGTDSVDIYGDEVRFHSPQHSNQRGTSRSFMTEGSGQLPSGYSHGRHISEAFLGMDNPSYSGGAAPGAVKNNPAYFEEPSASDQESMSVTMAFSSEDMYSQQGESTLKRKSKMKNIEAAAIARLRNSAMPPGMTDNDTSQLINNEVEVVYNERTAL